MKKRLTALCLGILTAFSSTANIMNIYSDYEEPAVSISVDSGYANNAYISFHSFNQLADYTVSLKKNGSEYTKLAKYSWSELADNDKIDLGQLNYNIGSKFLERNTKYTVKVTASDKDGEIISENSRSFTTTNATVYSVDKNVDLYASHKDGDLLKKYGVLKSGGYYTGLLMDDGTVEINCFAYKKSGMRTLRNKFYISFYDCKAVSSTCMNPAAPINQYYSAKNVRDGSIACGAAALACVLNCQYSSKYSTRSLRTVLYGYESVYTLRKKANRAGHPILWKSRQNLGSRIGDLLHKNKNVITIVNYYNGKYVKKSSGKHFIVICGADKNNFYVADSLYEGSSDNQYKKYCYFSQGLRRVSKKAVYNAINGTRFETPVGAVIYK